MRKEYKRLGEYIQPVNIRNKDLEVKLLLGVSITKKLIPSIANTIGSNMANYKIIERNQFAYGPVTSRNGEKISVGLLDEADKAIISQSYTVFEIIDINKLLPIYLMMWFSRPEFDRYARYHSHGSTRETFSWDAMCDVELPIPSIEKQRKIVAEYQAVKNKIKTNEQICEKLEAAAQALYKHWFVDFEFPNEEDLPYKSSGGVMVYNEELEKEIPKGWEVKKIEEVSNLKYGKMLNSSLFRDSGYPVFSGYGIRGYHNEYMYKTPQILVLCRGVSGTGRVEMSPEYAYITNLSIVVEINNKYLLKGYYYYHLKNENLRSLDSGSAQSQITIKDLGAYKTLIPEKVLQEKYQQVFSILSNYIKSMKAKNLKLVQLKSLLLARIVKEIKPAIH